MTAELPLFKNCIDESLGSIEIEHAKVGGTVRREQTRKPPPPYQPLVKKEKQRELRKMEGLIPLVCKTFKKNQTRRKYKCLSSSSSVAAAQAYNISDFYPQGFNYQYSTPQMEIKTRTTAVSSQHHNLRHSTSLREYSSGFSAARDQDMVTMKPKQLVRFRSHRFFSCVTGGA
ncbi:hypothetical protein RHMOL_Rhmol09G0002800 [Rhododendron molle]|uniref:Uncharacterized protein n=1 Tax=Rhododendron molle TaxID=49168 RepID=A0ACC0M7Z3_RHOML|nr:hypothetical protein RHMOL_Rhmol09G0002800 [Rhododendron molle]